MSSNIEPILEFPPSSFLSDFIIEKITVDGIDDSRTSKARIQFSGKYCGYEMTVNWKDGKKEGVGLILYPDGEPYMEMTFVNDLAEGTVLKKDEYGQIVLRGVLEHGVECGLFEEFDDEEVIWRGFYRNGKRYSILEEQELEGLYLEVSEDKELIRMKRTLTYNVPYRLQAPFIKNFKGEGWKVSARSLAEKINHEDQLIYYYVKIDGLQSQLEVKQEWAEYIKRNYQILCGWIRYHMITYLQRRNPSVPGIVNKLEPPICRQLEKVKRYWRMVLDVEPIHEIYSGELLSRHEISIDHFVPWSYVAHDEFWNLHPTTRRINSSKSNNLPDWKYYFQPFSQLEYKSYQLMWRYEDIHEEFVKLQKEHVNSMEIRGKLYRKGLSRQEFVSNLEEIMLPVYQAAEHMGFKNWRCE